MKLLDRLDRIVRPIAIPNVTQLLIAGQVVMLIADLADRNANLMDRTPLVWEAVLNGEVWRLLTFLFVPFSPSPIWLFFACYIFYLFGLSLQAIWGYVRYNAFLWLGVLLTVAAAAFTRDQPVTGHFLYMTVFLAFATYNPDFELRLFFVLPVKVKYLAYLQVAFYLMALISGPMMVRVMVLASVGNYLVFFAPMLFQRVKNTQRKIQWESKQYKPSEQPRHVCATCGINSNTHPKMDFRYCSRCDGEKAYCEDHLRNHPHVTAD
jgi:hypothetical protein